jgi:alpha-glucosidase
LRDPYGIRFWPGYKGRDGCRTPMVWEAQAEQGGFSDGKPWLPISAAHRALAVDRQQGDAESVLCRYRAVLAARRTLPALIHGSIELLETEGDVLAFLREEGAERLLCVFNFSEKAASLPVPARLAGVSQVSFPGASGEFEKDRITLAPLDYFIGRLV